MGKNKKRGALQGFLEGIGQMFVSEGGKGRMGVRGFRWLRELGGYVWEYVNTTVL